MGRHWFRLEIWLAWLLWLPVGAMAGAEYTMLADEGQGDYDIAFELPPAQGWADNAELQLAFDYRKPEAHHLAHLRRNQAWFEKVTGGGGGRIGTAGAWPDLDAPLKVTIKRRAWEMAILAKGHTVAWAHDEEPYGGRIGFAASGLALAVGDLLVQPIEPVRFSDDFMREPHEPEAWHDEKGEWWNVGLAGGKGNLEPSLSANPFSFRCAAPRSALATTGDWFWESYRFGAAVKATEAAGALGLAFYVQDPHNYYLFRFAPAGGAGRGEQLVRVVDGQPTVLDSATGGFRKDCWYRLEAAVSCGRVECSVDGAIHLAAHDSSFGQGKIGLWAENMGSAWFDDVSVTPWWAFSDTLQAPELGSWLQVAGAWAPQAGALTATSTFERPASLMMGSSRWHDYEVAVDVTPGEAEGVGLYACAAGPDDWYLLRWADGVWQLLRMQGGQLACLSTAPGNLSHHEPERLSLLAARGRLQGSVNGQPIIDTVDFIHPSGRVGLRAEGGHDVRFGELVVRQVDEPYRPVTVTPQFTQEHTMADWARRSSDWQLDPQTGLRWFRLPFFDDLSLRVPFTFAPDSAAGLRVVMGAVGPDDGSVPGQQSMASGLTVEMTPDPAGGVKVSCRRGEEQVAQAEAPTGAGERVARIDKNGLTTRIWLDDQPVLACRDGTWLGNSAIGLSDRGVRVDLDRVEAYSTNMLEYTFSGAPTDWTPELGLWQVTDRWSCHPGWAWFGGSKHQTPLLWSKHALYGDQVYEFWGALEMDTDLAHGGYTHPSDLNCTICGDGRNLCSGYSFVFAGDNNTCTKILKGNVPVAQTNEVHFVNPTPHNFDFHRHWFHVKAVKLGPELYLSIDDRWVLRWRDPQPLEGGYLAVWSYNNGILIARARATGQVVR